MSPPGVFSPASLGSWVQAADIFSCKSSEETFNEKMNEESLQCLNHFTNLIDEYNITHVAWELPPGFGGMGQQSRILSNMHSLKVLVWQRRLYYDFFHPTSMKKEFTGDGKAEKSRVRTEVISRWPQFDDTEWSKKDKIPPDVFDAIGIGAVAIKRNQWRRVQR